jgi:MFS family permease
MDAYVAMRYPALRRFLFGRALSVVGAQMTAVAVGWQLYEQTGKAFALGLAGLVELVPVVFLSLPAGHIADRTSRRLLAVVALLATAAVSVGLAVAANFSAPPVVTYALLFALGVAGMFRSASVGPLVPHLVPVEHFVNANSWLSSSFELASIAGPAIGGFVIALAGNARWAFALAALLHFVFALLLLSLPASVSPPVSTHEPSARDLFAGLRFIRRTPLFLGSITLDLFAVLLGGAVALLPIYAKDILHVGPTGLGWLRAAPAIGAGLMALVTTRLPPWKRPGRALLWTVAGFGAATIVFGLSRSFALSLVALGLTGVFDNVSVVIRLTLEQMLTPESMRGRVAAVHAVFIGFSNELGSFESGATAALFGTTASVVGGGIGTIVVVLLAARLWPQLSTMPPLAQLTPVDPDAEAAKAV